MSVEKLGMGVYAQSDRVDPTIQQSGNSTSLSYAAAGSGLLLPVNGLCRGAFLFCQCLEKEAEINAFYVLLKLTQIRGRLCKLSDPDLETV